MDFVKEKGNAEKLMEAAKEKFERVPDLVEQGKSLVEKIWDSCMEMVGTMEEDFFQGDRNMMGASVVLVMMTCTGFFLYIIFSRDK